MSGVADFGDLASARRSLPLAAPRTVITTAYTTAAHRLSFNLAVSPE